MLRRSIGPDAEVTRALEKLRLLLRKEQFHSCIILCDDNTLAACMPLLLESVPELIESTLVPLDFSRNESAKLVSACEFVLEGLYAQNKISRNEEGGFEATTKAKRDRRGLIYEDLTDLDSFN